MHRSAQNKHKKVAPLDVTKNHDRSNSRLAMYSGREKEFEHIYDSDREALERLIGMNTIVKKEPTLVERYPKEWKELHTPQIKLDYEARMRKYQPKQFFTPYGHEWHDVHTPDKGHWRASTPLHDEICRRTAIIPAETPKKWNTDLPRKRQALRALTPKEIKKSLVKVHKQVQIIAADVNYSAGELRKTLSTPKKKKKRIDNSVVVVLEKQKNPELQAGEAYAARPHTTDGSSPRIKRSFFSIPGNKPEDNVAIENKPTHGERTTIARRLFGKTIHKPKPHENRGALADVAALGIQ